VICGFCQFLIKTCVLVVARAQSWAKKAKNTLFEKALQFLKMKIKYGKIVIKVKVMTLWRLGINNKTISATVKEEVKKLWALITSKGYLKKLSTSRPSRLKLGIKHMGEMSKN